MATVNKAPPYPKQKYTDSKFREIIPLLSLAEYLKIEYLSKGVWFKMLSKRVNSYNCECCGVDNVGPTPITDHVRGKKHRFALQTAEQLYHPNYTRPKNSNAPARTPILDAYNGAAGATTAPKAAQQQKTQQQKSQQQKTGQVQKPAVQQKATGPQQKQQQKSAVVNKKVNATDKPVQPAVTPKANVQPVKQDIVSVQNQDKETADKGHEDNNKNSNVNESKKEQERSEVVVLDDDDDDNVATKTDPVEIKPECQAIAITSIEDAKPQRPQKRNINPPSDLPQKQMDTCPPGTEDELITPPKKVINPAAVLAQTIEKKDENTPRYQQNRVLIPTIDRTKKKQLPVINKQPVADTPSFAAKPFSTKTSNEIEGIIGVEYVVKILKVYNDPEPFYECCLCEVVMDGIGMQTHLLGYNHRYKYVEKHFPTCFNQYKEHIGNIQVMGIILDRISAAIEAHHGRELPYECLSGEFRSNRHGVMTTVYSFRHASEYSGPSFTNVVDSKQVEEFYKQKNVYVPPKPDPKRKPTFDTRSGAPVAKRTKVERPIVRPGSTRGGSRGSNGASTRRPYREELENNTVDDAVHKQMVEEFLQNTRGRSRSPVGGRRRRQRSRSRSRSARRALRRQAQRRSPSPLREGDLWQAYRHLVDRSKVELEQMYRDYRKDPEKHPLYDEEWRKFWKHRKEQMAREGLNHKNYDFQPEWVRYFAVRIEELFDEAVEDIKISCRKRLILPMTNDELEDKKYHVKVSEQESLSENVIPMTVYSKMGENKTSVVSVLRLLTALEDYLGSLGPRVVDLLSKALLVEKTNPSHINEIILNLENCTILETAMEKLKGVLIAGLLEGPKVRAFNNVITETEKILNTAHKMKQSVPQPVPAPKTQLDFQQHRSSFLGGSFIPSPQSNSMSSSGTGAAATLLSQVDKKELATKLAAALAAQGKTDFNPEQLQQLIAVYSFIDKKKRDSAAAADKQKMTLSDTLTALLNPTEKSASGGMSAAVAQPLSGRIAGNYSNNNSERIGDRSESGNSSSIGNFVSMLNRDSLSTGPSGNSGDTQMWQNLQNIQTSLRMQNTMGTSSNTGFNNSSMGGGGNGGGAYMDNMSGSNFNRGNFGGGSGTGGGNGGTGGGFNLGHNSSMNFNRSGLSGVGGNTGDSGDNSRFHGNFEGLNSNNNCFSRGRGDDMLSGTGRGGGGGLGGNTGNFSSGGSGGGLGSGFSRGGGGSGLGGGNNSGFNRGGGDNFLAGGGGNSGGGNPSGSGGNGFGSNFTGGGINNFSTAAGLGGGNNNYERGSGGMGGGGHGSLGMIGGNSGAGGSNFTRGGGSSGFGNSMNSSSNFSNNNKNIGRNDGVGSSFGSNQRGMGGNQSNHPMGRNAMGNNMLTGSNVNNSQGQGNGRGGSNWRNQ